MDNKLKYFFWNGLKIVNSMITNGTIEESKLTTALANKINAKELPAVTSEDNGDVLTVVEGAWVNATPSSGGGHNYSTSEQLVGTWIDGKPIYQRTFVTKTPTYFDYPFTEIDASDFDTLILAYGYLHDTEVANTDVYSLFSIYCSGYRYLGIYHDKTNSLVKAALGEIYFNKDCVITLQYTKISDTPPNE